MRIALLVNSRPPIASSHSSALPDDASEEYDGPDAIAAIAQALADVGEVTPLEADRSLARRLDEGAFDFAFNIAEGEGRRCREAHAAAVCEMLKVPFTHSDALTLALTLDKTIARRVVSPDVPVAPAVLVNGRHDGPPRLDLRYPVVVKPNDEGSSKGIRDDSVALDADHANQLINRVRDLYGCPVLVEQYLPGVEVTVGVIGNDHGTRVLGMMEIAPAEATPHFLYSVEAKRAFPERVRYFMPPRLPASTLRQVEESALTAYRLLGCRDIARLDFRLDAEECPRFLECNPLPGLHPDTSDIVILSQRIVPYDELVRGVLIDAARRHGIALT